MASLRPDLIAREIVSKMIEIRVDKGLSVNKLAWMSGVSPSAIAFLEKGTHSPTLKTFLRLADALELDVAKLYRDAKKSVGSKE
jgi:transcriptional regulator with XRE-family HTH domain